MYVYLLGAGASCNALPLVRDFPKRLKESAENMMERRRFLKDDQPLPSRRKQSEVLEDFVKSLNWLSTSAQGHISIDTLAKKLFISNRTEDLRRLKATLCCYLLLEQVLRPIDLRYDAFFASIVDLVDNEVKLPDNLKILTWNYDSQIERAFFPYWGRSTGLLEALQAYPIHYQRGYEVDPSKFCVIRLNGLAGLHIFEGTKVGRPYNLFSMTKQEEAMQALVQLYDRYLSGMEDIYPLLDFAWDEDYFTEKFRAVAQKVASTASVLVVIGYSFPFFNRKVDKSLLSPMTKIGRVYVQVPQKSFAGVKSRIESAAPHFKNITFIDDLSQFYIPHDF